jgi:hypothetical protein
MSKREEGRGHYECVSLRGVGVGGEGGLSEFYYMTTIKLKLHYHKTFCRMEIPLLSLH